MDALLSKENRQHSALFGSSELEKVAEQLLLKLQTEKCAMTLAKKRFAELDELIIRLEQCIFNASLLEQINFRKQFRQSHLAKLNAAYCAWETILEKLFVDDVAAGKVANFEQYRLTGRFERLISREMSLLSEHPVKNALFIGSGPFPASAIWMNQMLQVPVDCLDIDDMAIDAAKTFIKDVGLEGKLRVIHETSPQYDISKYDVIVIALLAKPKQEILANISESIGAGCQVICRTSHGLRSVLYEPTLVNREILGNFEIREQYVIDGGSDDTISSLLLEYPLG